eukprot:scaffold287079_cov67-Attheya_sp.AAC.3
MDAAVLLNTKIWYEINMISSASSESNMNFNFACRRLHRALSIFCLDTSSRDSVLSEAAPSLLSGSATAVLPFVIVGDGPRFSYLVLLRLNLGLSELFSRVSWATKPGVDCHMKSDVGEYN